MVGASFQPCIDSFVYFSLKMCMCVCTMQTLKLFQVISVFCFSFKDVRTREITLTTGSIVYLQFYIRRSHIPDTDTLKQFHHVEKKYANENETVSVFSFSFISPCATGFNNAEQADWSGQVTILNVSA